MKYWINIKGLRYNSKTVDKWEQYNQFGEKTGSVLTSDQILGLMASENGLFVDDPNFEQKWPKIYIATDKESNTPYHLLIRKSDKDEDCVVMPFCDGKAGDTKYSLYKYYRLHEITGAYKYNLINAFK